MEIIGLEIKKISIGKFFPKLSKVELDILFNDGKDKEILKTVDISDPEDAADDLILEFRKMEKKIHGGSQEGFLVDNMVNVVVKEEDKLLREIPQFLGKVKAKLEDIRNKQVADGYLDRIRDIKSLKIEF
jgi:hypothetical protein